LRLGNVSTKNKHYRQKEVGCCLV